jgi:DNA-binding NtrC family response regulator
VTDVRVLFVDDDDTLRRVLTRELEERGFAVTSRPSAEGLERALEEDPPDVVLLDLRLPGADGLSALRALRERDPDAQVVVLTGHGSIEHAVEAMRQGAHDFLTKPVRLDVLEQTLERAAQMRRLVQSNVRLKRAVRGTSAATLLGECAAMVELREQIARIAPSEGAVLIEGEHGTGKELVARALHEAGPRAEQAFVVVNCGAIPDSLVESELFGHEKGAFTGAMRTRVGLFEAAHEGTLFLDEVGELPRAVQPALLRALQFGEVRPVGSERTRRVDVRVVAATNRDLFAMTEEGAFREDLYYRLATLVIQVPPLRRRPGDVRLLARLLVERAASRAGRELVLDEGALRRLEAHSWPGNVRELENAAERLAILCAGPSVSEEDVERYVLRGRTAAGELPTLDLEELERRAVELAMKRHAGDKRAAAAELGIALKTLYNKLDRYGLREPAAGARGPEAGA